MSETVWRIVAIALIAAVVITFLKKTNPDMALLLVLGVCGVILFLLSESVETVLTELNRWTSESGISEELFLPLVKTVGIGVMTKTAGDICRDAGETAIGNLVEAAGAFAAILLAVPLIAAIWDLLCESL